MSVFNMISGGNYTLRKWDAVNIVADGNSNTINTGAGTDNGTKYTQYLMNHLAQHLDITKVTMNNIGVGNQTTIAMLADFDSQVVPLLDSPPHPNLLLMWEIGNDLYYNGKAGTQSRTIEYCQGAQAAGFKVIVMTCPTRTQTITSPAGDTPEQYNVKLEEINAYIRANYRDFADGLCDISYDARFRYPTNLTYFMPDGIHIAPAGREAIALLVSDTMRKIRL